MRALIFLVPSIRHAHLFAKRGRVFNAEMHVPKFSVELVSLDIPLLGIATQIHLNSALLGSAALGATIFAIGILGAAYVYAVSVPKGSDNKRAGEGKTSTIDFFDAWHGAPAAMAIIDSDGRLFALNARAKLLFGQKNNRYIGRTLHEFAAGNLLGDTVEPREHLFGESSDTATSTINLKIRDASGKTRELRGLAFPTPNARNNETTYSVVFSEAENAPRVINDASARQLAEYQTVLAEALPGALCTYRQDKEGRSKLVFASSNFQDVCGMAPDEAWLGPSDCFRRVHAADTQILQQTISEAARDEKPWQGEYRLHHPTKGEVWIEERSTPKRQSDGSILWHGVIFDITDRKRSEQSLMLSRERLAIAIDAAKLGVFELNLLTGKIFASERFREIVGKSSTSEILMAELLDAIHPDDRKRIGSEIRTANDPTGNGYLLTKLRIRRPDGGERWILSRSETLFQIRGDAREPIRVIGCILDITDNVTAEEGANRWAQLFEASGFGLAQIRVSDDTFIAVNRAFAEQRGYEPFELEGRAISAICPAEFWSNIAESLQEVDRAGHMVFETTHIRKDGSTFPVLMEVTVIKDGTGAPMTRIAYARDISKRREAEAALIETRQLHLTTIATLREGIMVFSKEGRLLSCNPSAERILGLSFERILTERSSFPDWACIREDGTVFQPEDFPVVRALATGQPCEGVVMGVMKPDATGDVSDENNIIWLLVNAAPIIETANAYSGSAVVSMIDISSLKASEKMQVELLKTVEAARRETQHQRNLFKGIFDGAPDGMIETDMHRNIRSVNPGVQRIFGYEPGELIGQSTQLLYASKDDWNKIGQCIEDPGQPDIMNAELIDLIRKGGQVFPGMMSGAILRDDDNKAIGYIAVMRDVTRERERDKALEESKRLESLGRLTAGIAHDFNNLLTVISVNLQLIDMSVHTTEMKRKVQAALLATNMGAKLNQRLTGMARKRRLNAEPTNLNAIIRGLYDILRVGLGERSAIKLALTSDLYLTNVDPNEVENVLLNLIINSRDAMPEGGLLSIETRNIDTYIGDDETNAQLPPGRYVRLSVTDTGLGMTADVLNHAIEPFYTTKNSGSGLGLAAVSDFVKQSKGHLALRSVEGEGTTVTINLPVYEEEITSQPEPIPSTPTVRVRRGVRILVVEDNQAVLEAVSLYLRSLGYDILSAPDAQQAVKIAAYHNDIDLLFTDLVLPGGGTGQELAKTISRSNPQIKVLFTSGYAENNDLTGYEGEFLLQKPYPLDELRRVIADKLAGE